MLNVTHGITRTAEINISMDTKSAHETFIPAFDDTVRPDKDVELLMAHAGVMSSLCDAILAWRKAWF